MKLWSLGSGSKGNAILLESNGARLLIDCGFGARTLAQRLRAAGVAPASIAHCVLTHEHGDHVRGAAESARRWGWTLHGTAGTLAGTPELGADSARVFAPGATLALDDFTIETHRAPHDASEPVVVLVTATAGGVRAGIVYDLGHVPADLSDRFTDLDLLVVESNHDEQMLRAGPYPPSVQARIAGRTGHLSNRAGAEFARRCANRNLSHVVLAHLSERCNDHGIAVTGARTALARSNYRGGVHAALQHDVSGPYLPRASRAAAVSQLTLF